MCHVTGGCSWAEQGSVLRIPFLHIGVCVPPGSPTRALLGPYLGLSRSDERPTGSPGPPSDFSFSSMWGTVCGFRWCGLVPELPPELYQWTDLSVFCHRAQGLWYEVFRMFIYMFSDSFQLLRPFPMVSQLHSQFYPLSLWDWAEQSPI